MLLLAGAAVTLSAVACGGLADEDITGARRTSRAGTSPGSASDAPPDGPVVDSSGTSSPAADASSPTTTSDAGAGASDSGPAPAPAPATAFTGAPAYVATTGTTSIRGAHGAFPNNDPAKQNCLGCHNDFFAGGTVYKDAAGTMPAAQVEVRVRSANGNAVRAYTDAVGNFFITKTAATTAGVTLPALVGARNATVTKPMASMISSGACNTSGCHAGNQGWAHVP